MLRKFAVGLLIVLAPAVHAQNFSCSIGDRGACLGYGDTICSSRGQCVSDDAVCFDQYQCGYEGFTCKSNVTECVADYNDLLGRRNALADDYNELLNTKNELVDDYNALLRDHRGLRIDYDDLFTSYEDALQR